MKILYNGGLMGREGLCIQGRAIIKELAKAHQVNIDMPEITEGYWKDYFNNFKGVEKFYVMNGHVLHLPKLAEKHKNIVSICVFETTLPSEWVDALNIPEVKEVWTISKFCKTLIQESGVTTPIKVAYLAVDERFKVEAVNIFPKDKSFKFLNVSAPHCQGLKDRKGLDILLKAFKQEFGDDNSVKLILKINTIYADRTTKDFSLQEYLNKLLPEGANTSNITILTDYFDITMLNKLYNSVDCGVFPARAEGFGLCQAEMMKLEKPVITSDYGATNEFSDKDIRCNILDGLWPLDYCGHPYYDAPFAEPDIKHLKELMRHVVKNHAQEIMFAKRHAETMKKFTWENTGKTLNRFLKELK